MKKPSMPAIVLVILTAIILAQLSPAPPAWAQQSAKPPAAATGTGNKGSGAETLGVKGQINPFSDVPAGGWPYRALSSLAGAGLLDGYRPDSFGPGRIMTRYEVAFLVARAETRLLSGGLSTGKKLPPGIQETLGRLKKEFKDEMAMLQIRNNVLASDPNTSTPAGILDRLQVTGVQTRQLNLKEQGGSGANSATGRLSYEMSRVARVDSEFKLNDRLEFGGRLASVLGKEDQSEPGQLGLAFNGRLWLAPQLSISSEYTVNGTGLGETRVAKDLAAAVSLIPDLLNVEARYRLEDVDNISSRGQNDKSTTTVAVDGEMTLNKQATLRAGYEIASTLGTGSEIIGKRTTTTVGLGYRLGENASLQANYQLIDFGDGEDGTAGAGGAGRAAGGNQADAGVKSPNQSRTNRLENAISAELSIKF